MAGQLLWSREHYCRDDWLRVGRMMSIMEHNYVIVVNVPNRYSHVLKCTC